MRRQFWVWLLVFAGLAWAWAWLARESVAPVPAPEPGRRKPPASARPAQPPAEVVPLEALAGDQQPARGPRRRPAATGLFLLQLRAGPETGLRPPEEKP